MSSQVGADADGWELATCSHGGIIWIKAYAATGREASGLAEGGTKASRAVRNIQRFLERIGPETIGPTDPEKVRLDMEEAAYLDMLQSMVEDTDPDADPD